MRRRPRRHLHEPRKLRANAARPLGEWLPDLFVRQATVAATIARTSPHHTKSTAMENIPFRPPLHSRRGVLHLGQGMLAVGTPTTLLSFICPAAAATGDQNQWRFCNKCQAMFFDGYPNKGRCPAGGGHVAQGYEFILHHDDNRQRAQTQRKPNMIGGFATSATPCSGMATRTKKVVARPAAVTSRKATCSDCTSRTRPHELRHLARTFKATGVSAASA